MDLATRPSGESTFWFVFSEDRLLLTPDGTLPLGAEPPLPLADVDTMLAIPDMEGRPCRAVEVSEGAHVEQGVWMPLRSSFDVLPEQHYLMAGKARELLYWDSNSNYCGHCGHELQMNSPISKCCLNCGRTVWPQLSTAIIVAITRGPEILLVQSRQFRGDYMGLVAGFVETGETLEDCVVREVREETGITIQHLRYAGSQAWPYPSGLMVGFRAEWESGELRLQQSELRRGGWYRADNLPAIPGRVSLARRLIDDWLSQSVSH